MMIQRITTSIIISTRTAG